MRKERWLLAWVSNKEPPRNRGIRGLPRWKAETKKTELKYVFPHAFGV